MIEARTARASAERRVLDLELEIEGLKKENQALKSKYAGLFLKTTDLLDKLKEQELAAANLIQGNSGSEDIVRQNEALQALRLTLDRMGQLQEAVAEYQRYADSLLIILKGSEVIRDELGKRGQVVNLALDKALTPLISVAKRKTDADKLKATVISVNEDIGVVILDRGTLSGVQAGRRWFLASKEGRVLAKLQTVECRAEYSAAVVTEGDASAVQNGTVLAPLVRNPDK